MDKIVVDSSVWIDFFNKKNSFQINYLKQILIESSATSPVIILPIILQEVLQGIEKNSFFNMVKDNLEGCDFLYYEPYEIAIRAAQLYRSLRSKGVTINKINDCLIATICIEHQIPLFHNDKDFDKIAKHTSLKIYKTKHDKN